MIQRSALLHSAVLALGALVSALLPAAGIADEIVAKGSTLRGTITHITANGIEIQTEFGKAMLVIPFADIERVETDAALRILHGEDKETVGRVVGVKDGKMLLVGPNLPEAQEIEAATIVDARAENASFATLRSQLRYWHGAADVGFGLTQATINNTTVAAGLIVERKRDPTRLVMYIAGHYGTQKRQRPEPVGPETHLADDLGGGLKGQYDLTSRIFLWASGDGKYDGLQKISYRVVPAAGPGCYLYKSERATLQIETGAAYVHERFFGGSTNDIRGVTFGAEAAAELPYAGKFHWRMDYLPAINDWTNTYLLRNNATVLFPLAGAFHFALGVLDEYDSHPARDNMGRLIAKENKLVTTAGLAVSF